ncbi:MAG: DUF4198 domain-containing protein [Acidobacteria bacterium]|nr:DUF4198 domain-containing protein [Acidobacteriota bacterium]MCA1637243.1 DUF4198 domain-containing protein [Acidobacteriota bacterium]
MRKKILTACLLSLSLFISTFAHDLFLKPDGFFVKVNEKISISILNGSFQASEGAVNYARLKDVSVVSPSGKRTNPVEADFTKNETTSFLNFQPTEAGTYIVGLSTMPREIDLEGKNFNEYLAHDGIPDTLAERKKKKELDKKVRERYSKHVKTIFQAGDAQTENYKTVLGYPVELVPQSNPYKSKTGETIEILCLLDGKPLVNQFVMTGRESNGKLVVGKNIRSDKKGIAKIKLDGAGKWYVRFIQMTPLKDPKINYESKWATLTFEIK